MLLDAPVNAGAVLHVGCASTPLPDWLGGVETRLDIDASYNPDIIASMTDLGDIGGFDFLYCSHALEHLYPHEVRIALGEFRRVLNEGGAAYICVPNLDGIKPTFDVVYETESGYPISGFHMYYGDPELIPHNPHMAHHSGFTPETLGEALEGAGFSRVIIHVHSGFNLVGIGVK